jgi:hypothetical protein
MLREGYEVYLSTRKKNDFAFNHYVMRPIAGYLVAVLSRLPVTPNHVTIFNLVLFLVAAAMLALIPTYAGGLWAIAVLEISYAFDCADGMLARHKKLASKEGHLFDFFTDEAKAVSLVLAVGLRLGQTGGSGPSMTSELFGPWTRESFHIATAVAVGVVASAISLTNFVRRPEISGRDQSVEAYYETVEREAGGGILPRALRAVFGGLRLLNHYPSHIYFFAIFDRFDAFFFLYTLLNALYLARGWLGLLVRFGRAR